MKDRYLFKAKRLDNGKWVQGNYVKVLDVFTNCEEAHIIFEPNTMFYSSGETDEWYKVDPTTICQCTGLKDKNSKLIWENDVIKVCWQDNETQYEEIAQVAWDEFGYYPWLDEYHCDGCDLFNEVRDIEVIGNIFDNPELIKESDT